MKAGWLPGGTFWPPRPPIVGEPEKAGKGPLFVANDGPAMLRGAPDPATPAVIGNPTAPG